MGLYKEWTKLSESQTDATFADFWKEYCAAESKIYAAILENPAEPLSGTAKELIERFEVEPALFMGFLDGVNESVKSPIEDFDAVTDETELRIEVDLEKLFFNMHAAQAEHLYTLEGWETALPADERERIETEYRRSRTVHVEKLPGRNDPCPCGSGLKYKKCCGKP